MHDDPNITLVRLVSVSVEESESRAVGSGNGSARVLNSEPVPLDLAMHSSVPQERTPWRTTPNVQQSEGCPTCDLKWEAQEERISLAQVLISQLSDHFEPGRLGNKNSKTRTAMCRSMTLAT